MLIGHAKTSKNIGVIEMTDDQKASVCVFIMLSFCLGWILGYLATEEVYQNHAFEAGVGYHDPQTGTFKYKIMDEKSGM